jgi:virginiamycin B lyase
LSGGERPYPLKTLPRPTGKATRVIITEYDLPRTSAMPHDAQIDARGIVWYGDFGAQVLGRLDPKTGAVTEWPSPGGPRSQPYGISAIGDAIWYSESNTSPNTLVRFDTRSHRFQTWPIPSGGGVVRNMAPTPDGNLWLACSGVNKIAFVEIGKVAATQ